MFQTRMIKIDIHANDQLSVTTLYNVPKFTNVHLTDKAILDLAEHENIIGMKESDGTIGVEVATVGQNLEKYKSRFYEKRSVCMKIS